MEGIRFFQRSAGAPPFFYKTGLREAPR